MVEGVGYTPMHARESCLHQVAIVQLFSLSLLDSSASQNESPTTAFLPSYIATNLSMKSHLPQAYTWNVKVICLRINKVLDKITHSTYNGDNFFLFCLAVLLPLIMIN